MLFRSKFKGNGNQRNNSFKGKRKAPSDRSGNGKPFKRSRNSRYNESNVVDNKKNEYILVSGLSANALAGSGKLPPTSLSLPVTVFASILLRFCGVGVASDVL